MCALNTRMVAERPPCVRCKQRSTPVQPPSAAPVLQRLLQHQLTQHKHRGVVPHLRGIPRAKTRRFGIDERAANTPARTAGSERET